MAVYLTFAKTILEKRETAIRSAGAAIFVLNEIQNTHLWHNIQAVYNYLSSSQLPCNKRHKYCPNIFKEFCILVTRAYDIFVEQFSSEHTWLQAAIFQGNDGQVYKELNLDLQACVKLFHESTGHPIPRKDSAVTIMEVELQFWSMGAQRDAADLRNRLKDLVARPALGEEERLLAEYLLDREMSSSPSDISQDDYVLPQFYRVECGYPASGAHIAHGSFGAVYKVNWLGMTCAKKHFRGSEDEDSIKEFMKEVNVLAKLNHRHIVKLLCTSVKPEISFVMEFMPTSLSDFIKIRWRSEKFIVLTAAIDMMLQIARGMEYLHGQGVAHRDLKSSNILVAPSKISQLYEEGYADVKLTDFGLAKMKVLGLTKPTRKKMGTTQWMAPEAYAADKVIDWKKADVYSFSMTCSEILIGKTPFSSGLLGKLYARIKKGERPKLPSSCPEDLASLLEACWHTEPSFRPSFTEIITTLTSVKSNLMKLRWDGSDCAGSESSNPPHLRGLRFLKFTSPRFLQMSNVQKEEERARCRREKKKTF